MLILPRLLRLRGYRSDALEEVGGFAAEAQAAQEERRTRRMAEDLERLIFILHIFIHSAR